MTLPIAAKLNLGGNLLIAMVAGSIMIGLANPPQIKAQSQPGTTAPLSFEIASIRPNNTGSRTSAGTRILPGNQTYMFTNMNLSMLIMTMYGIEFAGERLSGGPDWVNADRYDIEAKADRPTTRQQGMLMLEALLADRFKLKLHRETREVPIYALVVDKNGSKLRENTDGGQYALKRGESGQTIYHNASMLSLMQLVTARQVGRPVVDQTGLKGRYDFELEFTPVQPDNRDGTAATDPSGLPDIFTALRQQLGLRLESQKGPIEFFIIDHAEKPSEN